jgi:hypothetical protein
MARRDIFVFDFKIVELARKEITFKETKGGIVLKNKKFLFDDDSQIIVHEVNDTPAHMPVVGPAQTMSIAAQPHNPNGNLRPVKYMIFAPELPMMAEVKTSGIRFTPDRKYPVFKVQTAASGIGEVYTMIDDTGREQLISDKYFIPADVQLYADRESKFTETSAQRDGGKLLWGGTVDDPNMPNLRR